MGRTKWRLDTFDLFKDSNKTTTLAYLTESDLKEVQKILLNILDDIIDCCNNNNIDYALGGGSLLGAMRHKGFIPWDDDIDINFERDEYSRFIQIFKEEYGNKYWIHEPENTKDYTLLFTKIRDKRTIFRGRDDFFTNECGIGVDIYVLENTYDNLIARFLHGILSLIFGYFLSARKFYRDKPFIKRYYPNISSISLEIKYIIGYLLSCISVDKLRVSADKIHKMCKNNNTKFVVGCAGRLHFFGEKYPRNQMCKYTTITFENRKVKVPLYTEEYLRRCYGEWEKIPNKKEIHTLIEYDLNIKKEGELNE